jgi:hypothetical protein
LNAKATSEFEDLKAEMMSDRVVLQHPDWDDVFYVQTDASADGLGAVLAQRVKHPETGKIVERPVRYASRALQAPESKWTTREQELLGVVWACEKWHPYLWGRKFVIQTDHANLKWLETTAPTKGRLSRWAMRLSEYEYDMWHKPGKENNPPDALSRDQPRDSAGAEPEGEVEPDFEEEPEPEVLEANIAAALWVQLGCDALRRWWGLPPSR